MAHVFDVGTSRDSDTRASGSFHNDKLNITWMEKSQLISTDVSSQKLFFQAFGVVMSNPKAIVFLTALFPQFININKALIPQFSMLIATLMIFSFSFLMFYALLAHNVKIWLTKPNRIKVVNRTSGSVFIGFGVLLATSSNK